MIGIYKITNPKGKIYIGQSINIEKRFISYKNLVCKNQPKIYNSLIKHGVDKHSFDVIIECEIIDLNKLERYYQQLYNCIGVKGLNCKITNENDFNGSFCQETRDKMSISAKNKIVKESTKNKMSIARKGSGNIMYGKTHTDATKLKISLAKQNPSEQTRSRLKEACKRRSPLFYENLKLKNKGNLPPNCKIVLNLETGIFYDSVMDASRTLEKGKGSSTLACKLQGKRKNNTNFIYA